MPKSSPAPRVKTQNSRAVVWDIDGCLTILCDVTRVDWHNSDECNPYYASAQPDERMVQLNRLIYSAAAVRPGTDVILCTARPEWYRKVTVEWLKKNGVLYDYLVMRKTGDERADVEVKQDWAKRICAKYEVWFVIEDRPKTVAMWRKMGVLCLQCNEGY